MDQKVNLGFSAPKDGAKKNVATWNGFGEHGMRTDTTHDEGAALDFMMTLSRHLGQNVGAGRRAIYDARVKPKFVRENNREPKDRHEVRKAVLEDPYFQMWGTLRIYYQQKAYDIRRELVDRQLDELIERAKPRGSDKGTLELDADFDPTDATDLLTAFSWYHLMTDTLDREKDIEPTVAMIARGLRGA